MPLFRKGLGPHHVPVSMAGLRVGDRLLQIGCGDGKLFAALAAKVGLTGRACIVCDAEGAERARAAAETAGVYVEVEVAPVSALPYEDASFDLTVIFDLLSRLSPEERVRCLQQVWRVTRDGGRCLVLERASRGGLGALFQPPSAYPIYVSSGGPGRSLEAEGFRPVRRLAEREGLVYFEGTKARQR